MNAKPLSLAGEMLMELIEPTEPKSVRPTASRRQMASRELFSGGNELRIEHNGEIYTLRLTSKGKLILTK